VYSFIDYDVDLIVSEDGVAEIVDEEELTQNAHAMNYPPDTLRQIAEATAELVALFEAKEGPFDPDARARWRRVWLEARYT
ncbi:MAG TPA: hypothetical protein VFV52_15160, partial [Bacilli bacterium]|nr:hypothetical protein [Bacilli bacterium]